MLRSYSFTENRFQAVIQALDSLTSSSENLQTREDACEDHDEMFGNHSLESTLQSYSFSENRILSSDSGTRFINLIFRKSSNEMSCTNHFAFIWKLLLYITFVLPGRNSETNKSHAKETSRTWYWFGRVCNPDGCDQNFL